MGPSVLVWKNCHKFDVIKFTIPARIVQILQQRANVLHKLLFFWQIGRSVPNRLDLVFKGGYNEIVLLPVPRGENAVKPVRFRLMGTKIRAQQGRLPVRCAKPEWGK